MYSSRYCSSAYQKFSFRVLFWSTIWKETSVVLKFTLESNLLTACHLRAPLQAIRFMATLVPFFREWNPQHCQHYCTIIQHPSSMFSVLSLFFPTHISVCFPIKEEVTVLLWLIAMIKMQSAVKLVIESGENANADRLELPPALDVGM